MSKIDILYFIDDKLKKANQITKALYDKRFYDEEIIENKSNKYSYWMGYKKALNEIYPDISLALKNYRKI